MSLIGHATPIARRQRRITLSAPGAAVPDGDGGYTQTESALEPPALFAYVQAGVKAGDMERIAGSTTLPTATHLVTVPFHPQITTETVLQVENYPYPARTLKVVYVGNQDERNHTLELLCAEQVV